MCVGGVRSGGGWGQSAGEPTGARAAVSNLLKNRFNSLALATLPSAPLLVGLKPVGGIRLSNTRYKAANIENEYSGAELAV